MTFVAEGLPTFPLKIKTFNLENLLKFSNIRPWPLKNSSVDHRLRNPALVVAPMLIEFGHGGSAATCLQQL